MGGGLSRHELAAAVSEAGGLGTIAVNGAAAIERELAAARALTDRPIAVNLLLPFARRELVRGRGAADVVVTFWGAPKRRTGGHLDPPVRLGRRGARRPCRRRRRGDRPGRRGRRPRARRHAGARAARAGPGGAAARLPAAARRRDRRARPTSAGARGRREAAVAGTRFLLSEESRAHPEYKRAPARRRRDDPHRAVRAAGRRRTG